MSPALRALDPDALAALEEQHDFLKRSLDDLEREFAAGDLDQADYESLKADYADREQSVAAAIEAGRARFADARRGSSTGKKVAVVAGIAAFAILCGVLVAVAAGRRDSGSTASGPTTVAATTTREKLAQCFSTGQNGDLLAATQCYGEVIQAEPDNAEALTYLGWFLYLAGKQTGEQRLIDDAPGFLERAVAADPTYPDAHVFIAIIAFRDGRPEDALAQLDQLDALNPPESIQQLADQLRQDINTSATSTSSP